MKLLMIIASFLAFQSAQALDLNCYGNPDVDQNAPYLVTISGLKTHQQNYLREDFERHEFLIFDQLLDFGSTDFAVIGLGIDDTNLVFPQLAGFDRAAAINQTAVQEIKNIARKYQKNSKRVVIECNVINFAQPKAGGVN